MGCSLTLVEPSMNLAGPKGLHIESSSYPLPKDISMTTEPEESNEQDLTLYQKGRIQLSDSSDSSQVLEDSDERSSHKNKLQVVKFGIFGSSSKNLESTKDLERGSETKLVDQERCDKAVKLTKHQMQLKDMTSFKFNQFFTFKKQLTKCQDAFYKNYVLLDPIGKGAGGEAFKAFHKVSNQYRVIKMVHSQSSQRDPSRLEKMNKRLVDEANLISELDHPNIVKLHEVFECGNKTAIVMEYVEGEDLFKNIDHPAFKNLSAIATIIEQILSALVYLHGKGIIHKDLKLQNIVLEKADPYSNLKLIDFGFSEIQNKPETRNKAGTVIYMSPEVLENNHDTKCDIWALGVIVYYLIFNELPFSGNTTAEIVSGIRYKDINTMIKLRQKSVKDVLAVNFLRRLLERNPQKRYSAREALNDPFILKYAQKPTLQPSDIRLLKKYQEKTIMELGLSSIFVHHLMTNEEKADFIRVFRALDKGRKGHVSYDDLKILDESLGNSNHDSSQGLELSSFMIAGVDVSDSHNLRRLFMHLDKDNDMLLKFEEIFKILKDHISHAILQEIAEHSEKKERLELSYQDFKNIVKLL